MTTYCQRGLAARVVLFVFFGVACASAIGSVPPSVSLSPNPLVDTYGKLPILFESNRGQADPAARFIARGNGYAVYLTQHETLIALSRQSKLDRGATPSTITQTVIGMRFAGARKSAPLTGERKADSISNYFLGPDPAHHITDVPHYSAVRQSGIYPGIDAVFYGNQRQLEYDLVVAPGADPRAIRLSFTAARKVSIDRAGNLVLQGATGDVIQHKPVIYQEQDGERKTVAGSYIKRGREVGFQIAAYDKRLPLIIDPVVSYATFLGGVKNDSGQAIAVDAAGNAYITGYTSSPKFPAANPIDRRIGHNEQDAFVVKLNATGTALIYSTYLGGSKGVDSGNGIAVDSAGNAYVAGTTTGKGFPTTTGAYQSVGTSWIAKLNPTGNALVYSTAIAGARINALALDAGGNAYVTGWTDSTFVTTTGSFQPVNAPKAQAFSYLGSFTSAFVAKLNPTGTALVYGTYLAGYGTDEATGIALDQSGSAYVTGGTNSGNFPLQNPIQAVNRGGSPFAVTGQPGNAFITKLNSTGSGLVYSTFLGGGLMDIANAIAVDATGSAHIVGTATSQDFPVHNSFQPLKLFDFYLNSAAFVAKLNAAGDALVYSSLIGGDRCPAPVIDTCLYGDGDQGLAVALDSAGNAYYTGAALGERFPTLYPIQPDRRQGSNGLFVAKVAPTGQAINIFMLGGSGIAGDPQSGDFGRGIAIDGVNAVYLTGDTSSIDFPVTPGAVQPTLLYNTRKDAGGQDAFIAKFTSPNNSVNITTSANPILAGQSVSFTSRVSTSTNPFPSSGAVTFMSNYANEGTVPVVNGSATTMMTPTAGVKRISAATPIRAMAVPHNFINSSHRQGHVSPRRWMRCPQRDVHWSPLPRLHLAAA